MSPKTRPKTRAQNATTHPGDAVPKQVKRTKAQLDAAKEALKSERKKKEVEKQRKLTNVAQAEDEIVLGMQAEEASVPRTRPKNPPLKRTYAMLDVTDPEEASGARTRPKGPPLKRTYAMLDVTETDNEIQLATSDTGGHSDSYVPSEHSASASEPIDPASDSDGHTQAGIAELPKKKRGRPKKASVLNEIKKHRRHLDPILEEDSEHEVEEQEPLMADEPHVSHAVKSSESQGLPFKAGLKKSWVAQRTGNATTAIMMTVDSEPTVPKTSKRGVSRAGTKSTGPAPIESVPTVQKAANTKKAKSSAKESAVDKADIPEAAQTQPTRPRPRPRSRPQASSQDQAPETPLAPSAHQAFDGLQATPLNIGGGIPSDDETDTEEYAAAKSSPIKAGTRITSNAIVAIQPKAPAQTGTQKPFHQVVPVKQAAKQAVVPLPQQLRNVSVAPKLYTPTNVEDIDVDIDDDVQPQVLTRPVPKPQNNPKPTKSMQEVVEPEETVELELEQTHDRASVAPSEGSQFGHTRRPRGFGRSHSATYDCLPPNAPRETFKNVYMPTVAKYLGKLSAEIWSTSTAEHMRILQVVWNEVFPKAPYTFSTAHGTRCDIARLICQRGYEWRGRFASAAIEAVLDLEASDADYQDPDFRAAWVLWATEEGVWPFLYAETDSDDSEEWTGTFASALVTKTFASHLASTADAVVIKKLRDIEDKPPSGALALATAAVERALAEWNKGHLQDWRRLRDKEKPSLSTKFDGNTWGPKTESWLESTTTVDPASWNDIINTARGHIRPTSRKPPSSRPVETSADPRAKLVARPRRK